MSNAPKIILLPFSPVIFPKKFFKRRFALNKWPQYPVSKWLLMGPFILFIVITLIPLIILGLANLIIQKSFDSDKFLEGYERFLKLFADMGFSNSGDWDIERDYRNPNANKETLKILYLKNNEASLFEKINPEEFWKFADEVWVYRKEDEIFKHLNFRPFDTKTSYWVSKESNGEVCTFSYLNEDNKYIKEILEEKKEREYKQFQKQKQRHPQIQLQPNDILPPEIVYYYEPAFDPIVNHLIQINIDKIDASLANRNFSFMYLPRILGLEKYNAAEAIKYTGYTLPTLRNNEIEAIVKDLKNNENERKDFFKNLFEESVGIPELKVPCFIRCVENNFSPENKKFKYSVFPLIEEADETIQQKIDFYLNVVGNNEDGPQYRRVTPDESEPDDYFFYLDRLIDPTTKAAIDSIKKMDDQKMLISSMAYIINTLKASHPELCKKLNSTLYDCLSKTNNTISRLVFDEQYRIFLPDYNNIEVEMGPLPKTVFIFLLKHPEGVLFKDLRPHVNELVDIYAKVGNRLDMDQIKESILDLTDPRSNSINEKCSRIKEAFISKIDNLIAQNYYVTGNRSSNKGIKLDRSLVQFPQTK